MGWLIQKGCHAHLTASGASRQTGFASSCLFTVLILSFLPYDASEQLVIRYKHHRRPAATPRVRHRSYTAYSIQRTRILFLALVHQVGASCLVGGQVRDWQESQTNSSLGNAVTRTQVRDCASRIRFRTVSRGLSSVPPLPVKASAVHESGRSAFPGN